MTNLSVNVNKIAWLRNARGEDTPNVVRAAHICIAAGADGITVHPRQDGRHIREQDVRDLGSEIEVEFNVEGYPSREFIDLVLEVSPAQVTLVPDGPTALTSDHGWPLLDGGSETEAMKMLRPILATLKDKDLRVSLFPDPDVEQIQAAADLGADRVELYTKSYADAADHAAALAPFRASALAAQELGIGVNAGHDLNLTNLGTFLTIPGILEVSIGHALISDALDIGLANAVKAYREVIELAAGKQ